MPPLAAISYGARVCLFSGDHGLVYSQGIVMASIDVHGCCILCQVAAGSDQPLGIPRAFQY